MQKKVSNLLLLLVVLFFLSCNTKSKPKIHISHLTSGWYPQNKETLDTQIDDFFKFCKNNFNVAVNPETVKALIAPHAGYYFSGICAASVYQNLLENKETHEKNNKIKKVIILSPSHAKAFKGISLPDYTVYQTCLGELNIDQNSIEILKQNEFFQTIPNTHEVEHAIEVQLPFLQKTIKDFTIVPLIVGQVENNQYEIIAKELNKIIDDSTLIVISSDFVHHGKNYNYKAFNNNILDFVRFIDAMAVEAIIQKSYNNFDKFLQKTAATICGQNAIKILLKIFELNKPENIETRLCCYYTSPQIEQSYKNNSGKVIANDLLQIVPDDKAKNSVSYLGILFTTEKLNSLGKEYQLTDYEKKSLAILSRRTIENEFKNEDEKLPEHLLFPIKSLGLYQPKGAFVTINTKSGNLRGCIGQIISQEPLFKTVQKMSKTSAFHDTRFKPLQENELPKIIIDISILTTPKPVKSYNDIEIGKHGIILKKITPQGIKSSVFLPHVPPSFGWDLPTTLEHLSIKAGLPSNAWKEDCEFEVFEGIQVHEK